MLKIVPDPPHDIHSLEETLILATDYALCIRPCCCPLSLGLCTEA